MSQRYAQLHERKASVSQLGNVVTAMRGIAAARAQQSHQQLESVQAYAEVVAESISQVLALAPDAPAALRAADQANRSDTGPDAGGSAGQADGERALILIGAEQGFAGAFSERVFEQLDRAAPEGCLLVVGSRAMRLAAARGWRVAWSAPMVAQLDNSGLLADRIATALFALPATGPLRRVDIVHARPLSLTGFEVLRRQLLPLDFERFRRSLSGQAPLLNLRPQQLLAQLAAEYLFAQLNEAIVHSFAAENTARLQTMTAARENIARRLEGLSLEERLARQEEITAEIVELAAGTEAQRADVRAGLR